MEQQKQQPIQEETDINPPIKTNWKFLAIAVVFSLVVGGGILWYVSLPQPEIQPTNFSIPPKPKNEVLDTSTWQTYRNDEFGFELKYPNTHSIAEGDGHSPLAHPELRRRVSILSESSSGYIDIDIADSRNFPRISDYITEVYEDGIVAVGDISIAGIKTSVYKLKNSDFFYILLMNKTYIFDAKSPSKELLSQILATFRFVE